MLLLCSRGVFFGTSTDRVAVSLPFSLIIPFAAMRPLVAERKEKTRSSLGLPCADGDAGALEEIGALSLIESLSESTLSMLFCFVVVGRVSTLSHGQMIRVGDFSGGSSPSFWAMEIVTCFLLGRLSASISQGQTSALSNDWARRAFVVCSFMLPACFSSGVVAPLCAASPIVE